MKVLLVTGSSRGIGAEICRQAAADGWKVCINYAHSEDEADRVVHEIRENGGVAIALQANVANEGEVITMFERIDLELGPLTGLVNNAGTVSGGTRIDEMDVDASRRVFEVNILGQTPRR
jgi:NAD(P)-dependent dehydrogenase (short-subunit alcohol dehydrogenase family)